MSENEMGRVPTIAHPLCECVVSKLSFASLIGCYTDGWQGPQYVRTVTSKSRAACPMHAPARGQS